MTVVGEGENEASASNLCSNQAEKTRGDLSEL
jgi:hypothetical protein